MGAVTDSSPCRRIRHAVTMACVTQPSIGLLYTLQAARPPPGNAAKLHQAAHPGRLPPAAGAGAGAARRGDRAAGLRWRTVRAAQSATKRATSNCAPLQK